MDLRILLHNMIIVVTMMAALGAFFTFLNIKTFVNSNMLALHLTFLTAKYLFITPYLIANSITCNRDSLYKKYQLSQKQQKEIENVLIGKGKLSIYLLIYNSKESSYSSVLMLMRFWNAQIARDGLNAPINSFGKEILQERFEKQFNKRLIRVIAKKG